MRKSGLSHFSFCLLATAIAAVGSPVYAQAMKMYDPMTSWSLVKTPNANSPKQSYCTITQKYMGDVVVSYARNMNDERSLALDFQSGKFEAGKQYAVQIKTAGAYDKTFNAKPLKGNTFVLSLGKDEALERDLSMNRTLEAIIEGNTYRFNAAEFDVSAPRLQNCVTEVAENIERETPMAEVAASEPAKQEPEVVKADVEKVAAAPVTPQDETMPKPAAKMPVAKAVTPDPVPEDQYDALPSKIVEKTVVKEVPSREAIEKVKLLEDQLRAAAMERESVQKEKQGLLQKVASLEAQSKSVKSNAADAADRNAQLKKISSENETLKSQIASLNAKLKSLEADKVKLASAAPAPSCPSTQQAKAKLDPQIMADLAALEAENEELNRRLIDTDARLAQAIANNHGGSAMATGGEGAPLRKQVLALREELKDLQSENARLRELSAISPAAGGGAGSKLALSDGNWNLEKATSRYQQAEREVKRLGLLVDEERQKCKSQKREIEYMLFDPAISSNAQMSMLNKLESKLAESNDRVAELETRLAAYDPSAVPTQLAALDEPLLPMAGDESEGYQISELTAEAMPAVPPAKVSMTRQALKDKRAARAAARERLQAPLDVHPTLAMLAAKGNAQPRAIDTEELSQDVEPLPVSSLEPGSGTGNRKLIAKASQAKPEREVVPPVATQKPAPSPVILKKETQAAPAAEVVKRDMFPGFRQAQELNGLLAQAKVQPKGQLQPASSASNAGVLSYRWQTDKIDGAIEQRAVGKGQDMDALIKQHVSRLERECTGEFAASPNDEQTVGSKTISTWDIACMNGNVGKASSIAFQFDNEVFTAFVQESTPEEMTVAMDTRDALAEALVQ